MEDPTLNDHRHLLQIGARFHYTTYFAPYTTRDKVLVVDRECGNRRSLWEVLRIVERGVVVGHPLHGRDGVPGGHEHLIEWDTRLAFFEIT